MKSIKEFLKRNSFIVIITIAILIAGTNYLVYPVFIKKNLNLSDVPIATQEIPEGTLITNDMIKTISIDKSFLPEGIVLNSSEIVGQYAKIDYTIPSNSFVYADALTNANDLYGSQYGKLKDGKYAFDIANANELTLPYDIKNEVIKEGMKISVFYREEFKNEYGETKHYIGQLAENCEVINVDSDTITIAIDELDVGLFMNAQVKGEIIPLTSWQSTQTSWAKTQAYDIYATKNHLKGDVNDKNSDRIYFKDGANFSIEEEAEHTEASAENIETNNGE